MRHVLEGRAGEVEGRVEVALDRRERRGLGLARRERLAAAVVPAPCEGGVVSIDCVVGSAVGMGVVVIIVVHGTWQWHVGRAVLHAQGEHDVYQGRRPAPGAGRCILEAAIVGAEVALIEDGKCTRIKVPEEAEYVFLLGACKQDG